MYEYAFETQDNGLRVAAVPMPHLHSVAIQAWVHGGSAYEPVDQNGISHLLEHLHMGPTRAHTTRGAMNEAIDKLPGWANARTSENGLCFEITTSPGCVEPAAELLSQILEVRPFSKEAIADEKRLLETELSDEHPAGTWTLARIFPKHPFGMSSGGTGRTIGKLKPESIAETDRKMFAPDRIAVAIVGPTEERELRAARVALGRLRSAGPERLTPPPPPVMKLPMIRRESPWTRLRHVAMGFVIPPPLRPEQEVALTILNMGPTRVSGPLFDRLRYEAAAYDFNTAYMNIAGYRIVWLYGNVPARHVHNFIDAGLKELTSIGRDAAHSAPWFETTKADFLFWTQRSLDEPESVAHRVLTEAFPPENEPRMSIPEEFGLVRSMTREAFEASIRDLFRKDRFFLHYQGRRYRLDRRRVAAVVDGYF